MKIGVFNKKSIFTMIKKWKINKGNKLEFLNKKKYNNLCRKQIIW